MAKLGAPMTRWPRTRSKPSSKAPPRPPRRATGRRGGSFTATRPRPARADESAHAGLTAFLLPTLQPSSSAPLLTADTGEWGTYAWVQLVLGAPGYRIAGGSDEIQRNIIAERVLGLPAEPRVDRGS
jgi:hypothetical protein